MIPYTAHPILLQIGALKIQSYGFLLALSFLIGTLLAARKAKKRGIDPEKIYNLVFWSLIGAVIGSRIGYVLLDLDIYLSNPSSIFKFWDGGLAFYGGFIGAILFAFVYLKIKKLNFWRYANLLAPYIALGLAITRIGCFLVPDDFGIASTLPWAMNFGDGILRHPAQLYMVLQNFVLFLILRKIKRNTFLWFLGLYGITRFFMEFIRDYPQQIYFLGLTVTQIISLVLFIGSGFWLRKRYRKKKK